MQLMHQGTTLIPTDFILCKHADHPHQSHHDVLFANCIAQMNALAYGKSLEQAQQELASAGHSEADISSLAPHKVIPGNRPSTFIMLDQLSPTSLGTLIALYEHKVFVQSILWNINAFDQWGVELGKQLSKPILNAIDHADTTNTLDPHTQALINRYKSK